MFEPVMLVCHEPGIMINLNDASEVQKRKWSRSNRRGKPSTVKVAQGEAAGPICREYGAHNFL